MDKDRAEVETPDRLPVLIISHTPSGNGGHAGRLLVEQGHALDVRRPRFGDSLPESLEQYAGVAMFGGPMSAMEPEEYLSRELAWLELPLKENKPVLGVCLGAQMVARSLGGDVRFHAEGMVENGYQPLHPTKAGAELMDWPSHVYQWHREGFTLPQGAVRLAEGDIFKNQAFRYGERVFGVQFHPEVTHSMMHRWTQLASQRLALPGARPRRTHFSGHLRYAASVRHWLDGFLKAWIATGEESGADR
jgi:GMP synthase (glutamine-hydrolysing)